MEIIHARVLQDTVNPLTPKIGVVILQTVCRMIFILLVWKFGTGSISNLIVGIFLYFSSLVCMLLCRYSKEKFCHGHSQELEG